MKGIDKDQRGVSLVPSHKKFVSNISKWKSQQEARHLNGTLANEEEAGSLRSEDHPIASTWRSEEDFDYADEGGPDCLLCKRHFKDLEILKRHIAESELHKDAEVCLAGRKRVEAAKGASRLSTKASQSVEIDSGVDTNYKDRAKERREVFGTQTVPGSLLIEKESQKSSSSTHVKMSYSPELAPKLDGTNRGGAMLAKMGWEAGKGLGSHQTGRVDPVEAMVYTQGAGLGSAHSAPESAEVTGNKRSRALDYLDYARQQTRTRYK